MRLVNAQIAERAAHITRPTFADVLLARQRLAPYLRRTALYRYPVLDERLGMALYVKHENHQPTGSFKVRGGLSFILAMRPEDRARGVITASSGNHGQGVAWAAELTGTKARVLVAEKANPLKVASMRAMGAEVVHFGPDFDAAKARAKEMAAAEGLRFVDPGNEPEIVAGIGTETLEILEDAPEVDTVIVPVGSGSGAAGACLVAKTLCPQVRVIGVQAAGASAVHDSWKANRWVTYDRVSTFADGLATREPFALALSLLIEWLDDFVTLTEDEIRGAVRLALEETRNLAEGAGAAALGAAVKLRDELQGHRVAVVMSGGNLSLDELRKSLA